MESYWRVNLCSSINSQFFFLVIKNAANASVSTIQFFPQCSASNQCENDKINTGQRKNRIVNSYVLCYR